MADNDQKTKTDGKSRARGWARRSREIILRHIPSLRAESQGRINQWVRHCVRSNNSQLRDHTSLHTDEVASADTVSSADIDGQRSDSSTSMQTRASTSPSRTFSPAPSKLEMNEESVLESETEPVIKPLTRSNTRTFPRSNQERRNDPVVVKIPRGRHQDYEVTDSNDDEERDKLRQLQPVAPTFQGDDPTSRRKRAEMYAPSLRVRTLQFQLKKMQRKTVDLDTSEDSRIFVETWSAKLLPQLEQILDEKTEEEYTINVTRGSKPGLRIIVIMTTSQLSPEVVEQLNQSKTDCLPCGMDSRTSMIFREGQVDFLKADTIPSAATSLQLDDPFIDAINTYRYSSPAMGDSVGWQGESATLGPVLQIDEELYRLVNWHLFDDDGNGNSSWDEVHPPAELKVYHPSSSDQPGCADRIHFGDVVAYSGLMYETSRLSALNGKHRPSQTITDWALVDSTGNKETRAWVNKVRILPEPLPDEIQIDSFQDPASFFQSCNSAHRQRLVYSSGRTTGYTVSLLTEVPMVHSLPDKTKTTNWALEHCPGIQSVDEWVSSGTGVPGDSGAGVFCSYTNALLGQVWGRNTYRTGNPSPRIAFFTSMVDIFADIRERKPCNDVQLASQQSTLQKNSTVGATFETDVHLASSATGGELAIASRDTDRQADRTLLEHHSRSKASIRHSGRPIYPSKASFVRPEGCKPMERWARAIIHASTF
ncbi:hypothetical protein GGR57DRAFT_396756 [Xylariaceae sp. FL1272]|nr:hypothetical protein GGR57DRAFT_396756 [Xylariaceae sp. FL1272]